MDPANPLTRQFQDTFEPKIAQLYQDLFDVNASDEQAESIIHNEGFWRELFLLKPEKQKLSQVLSPLSGVELLHIQGQTRTFFRRAIAEAGSGVSPQNENALENLTGFMVAVLAKRFTHPSTDIIEVLAGLDAIDKAMSDLVNGMEMIIRQSNNASFRTKAVEATLATVAGSYQTSLATYFMYKDFFPGLMKYVKESPDSCSTVLPLIGLLANHNKFEAQNVYQNRMEDFVNDQTIAILVDSISEICADVRADYIRVQDDGPAQWTMSSTLSSIGLRALTPEAKKPPPPTEDEAKALYTALPSVEASALLATYTFVQANNIFASTLVTKVAETKGSEPPLAAFLSIASYLTHHAHRSERTQTYAILSLLTIRLLVEDPILAKRLSTSTDLLAVRLCRQRAPQLPYSPSPRPATAHILDILTTTMTHNLRLRISIPLYSLTLQTLHATLAHLSATKTRLHNYTHWPSLWQSLLSLLRFFTTYASDIQKFQALSTIQSSVLTPLVTILVFALLRGDDFLPDPDSYDDLFYKLIEASSGGEDSVLHKFVAAYKLDKASKTEKLGRAIGALTAITAHYQTLLGQGRKKAHQNAREVTKVIREGYESLGGVVDGVAAGQGTGKVAPGEYFAQTAQWRESEWKAEMKRVVRVVVEDGRALAVA